MGFWWRCLVASWCLIWFLGSSGEERWSGFARFFFVSPLFRAELGDLLESLQLLMVYMVFLWVWDAYWLHSCSNSSASGHFADRGEVPIPGWVEIVSVPAAISKSFLNF